MARNYNKQKAKTQDTESVSLWNGPRLEIPIDVSALVVSERSLNLPWSLNPMKYNNHGQFKDVSPDLFNDSVYPSIGITLQWALPDGLTHGIEDELGQIEYPLLPNRWLVVRVYDGKTKSWILESDFEELTEGNNLFLKETNDVPTVTRIGRDWLASEWAGDQDADDNKPKFLKAISPGNIGFTAYGADIKDVFSFQDDMSEILTKATPVTYYVTGWYSDPLDDPLYGRAEYGEFGFQTQEEWQTLMNRFQWSPGNDNDLQKAINDWTAWATANGYPIDPDNIQDILPAQTLCQGMVYQVNWLGKGGALQSGVPHYDSSVPLNEQPKIAVGNTSTDALAALIKYELDLEGEGKGEAAAEFLLAFSNNLLAQYETPGGQYKLFNQLFESWFQFDDSESYWYVENKTDASPVDLSDEMLADLINLNLKALRLKKVDGELVSGRRYLYGNWWKQGKAVTLRGRPPAGITQEEWDTILANLAAEQSEDIAAVEALLEEAGTLSGEIETLKGTIEQALESLPELQLQHNSGPRYNRSNDPVVLLYGAGRSYRHGEDNRYGEESNLFTRFTGQSVKGLLVAIPDQEPPAVDASNSTIPTLGFDLSLVPKEIPSMNVEAFFLDTNNAQAIAETAAELLGIPFDPAYTLIVETQQTSIYNSDVHSLDRQIIEVAAGIIGTIPSSIAVNPWQPPWSPLFLAWKIEWWPSYTVPEELMEKWSFVPEKLGYQWDESYSPIMGDPFTMMGTSILTPQSAVTLRSQLEKYLDETGDYPELREFVETVADWDFLSQSLGGLDDQMLAWSTRQLNEPTGTVKDLTGEQSQYSPQPGQTDTGYFPLRAGHFRLQQVWVVDDFGQVFDPISAVRQTPVSYQPAFSENMVTKSSGNLGQLAPRITQAARMRFDLKEAIPGGLDTLTNQEASPICGWVLPNFLDNGLSIYDQSGNALGEILQTGSFSNLTLNWFNAPGTSTPVGTSLEASIENPYLRGFVQGLLGQENNAQAYEDLLLVIDEALRTVVPLAGRGQEAVAVLIGRPLAILRASVNYDLAGGLQYEQAWLNSTLKQTGGYENVDFKVQIGSLQDPSDGAIGYFDVTFDHLYSIHTEGLPLETNYVSAGDVSLSIADSAKDIYILADPSGDLNVVNGILPVQRQVVSGPLVQNALQTMEVTFRTGPLITDPQKLRMPLPTELQGDWSYLRHSGVTTWEEIHEIAQANQEARFTPENILQDGWLKLANAIGDSSTSQPNDAD